MTNVARHALVSGRVQGVAFRHHAKVRARELGLAGWVQNLADGRVEVWFEGPESEVAVLQAWLGHGPPLAHVESVAIAVVDPAGHALFKVRFG